MIRIACIAAAAAALLAAAPAQQSSPTLVLRAVRFHGPDDKTRVKAFLEIPHALLEPTTPERGSLSFQVGFRVADSTGLTLFEERWPKRAPASLRESGGVSLEMLDFALAPGRYRLEAVVYDSVSGRRTSSTLELEAFSEQPLASDLLLSPRIRTRGPTDSAGAGEFPRGNVLVTAAAELRLTPLRSKVFYLLEAYSPRPDSGQVVVTLLDRQGKAVVRTQPASVWVAEGGGLLRGQLDLTGLPPGQYTLRATVRLGERQVERESPLVMAELEATLARAAEQAAAERETDQGYFAAMGPQELERAKAPLVYIADKGDNLSLFDDLSDAAKRNFLVQFWRRRDPDPSTPRNEARDEFYRKIDYANRTFREGGRNPQAGWRSDRGRIYIQHGPPDDMLARQQEGEAPPYQVWRYTRGQRRYYIFADRTGFGAYNLIASNDLKEPPMPGWRRILGAPAVVDIERFLGVMLSGSPDDR